MLIRARCDCGCGCVCDTQLLVKVKTPQSAGTAVSARPGNRGCSNPLATTINIALNDNELLNARMGRTIDQDVHAAFVEFKAKGRLGIVIASTVSSSIDRLYCTTRVLCYHCIALHEADPASPHRGRQMHVRPVHLLSTDPSEEHLTPEATSARVSWLSKPSQCPSTPVRVRSRRHRRSQRLRHALQSAHSQWSHS